MLSFKQYLLESYYATGRVPYTGEIPSVHLGNKKTVQHLPVSKTVKPGDIVGKRGNKPLRKRHQDIPDPNVDIEKGALSFALKRDVKKALNKLRDRERFVVSKNLGLDDGIEHTFADIARELGVSNNRVSQIFLKALRKLRHPKLRNILEPHT